jgi:hypothetical protein
MQATPVGGLGHCPQVTPPHPAHAGFVFGASPCCTQQRSCWQWSLVMASGHEQHASIDVASVQSSAVWQKSMSGDGQCGQQNCDPRTGGPCSHSTAGQVTPAQEQAGHWQGCCTSMPSGHEGAMHTKTGSQPEAPPKPLPATPPVPAGPPSPVVPEAPAVPAPEGCNDPLPHPATQATASATPSAAAPREPLDHPGADVHLSLRPNTTPGWQGFQATQRVSGAIGTGRKKAQKRQGPRSCRDAPHSNGRHRRFVWRTAVQSLNSRTPKRPRE